MFRYEELRIPRINKIAAYAAEMTLIPDFIPEWVKKLPLEEQRKRDAEFKDWTLQYPEAMQGDPNSTYWKP